MRCSRVATVGGSVHWWWRAASSSRSQCQGASMQQGQIAGQRQFVGAHQLWPRVARLYNDDKGKQGKHQVAAAVLHAG